MTAPRTKAATSGRRIPVWAVMACGALVLWLCVGTRQSLGLFLQPMSAHYGWGREVLSLALAVQLLLWGVGATPFGALSDRFGAARVLLVGAIGYVAGLYFMSRAGSTAELVLSAGVLIGFGLSATSFSVVLPAVSRIVPARIRSTVMGVVAAGGSVGQFLMVPLAQGLIEGIGWALALVVLAASVGVMIPLSAGLAGRAPQDVAGDSPQSVRAALVEAGKNPSFLYLSGAFFVCGFQTLFIATHLPAYVVDSGLSPTVGAAALAMVGLGNVAGSFVWGWLGDRYSKTYCLSALYLIRAIAIVAFLAAPVTAASAIAFATVTGFVWLGTVPLVGGIIGQVFGLRHMGMLFGVVFLSHQVGGFLGAWLGGSLFDITGSYAIVWGVAVWLGVTAALLHLPLDERALPRVAPARTA
jgi:MFS family permease